MEAPPHAPAVSKEDAQGKEAEPLGNAARVVGKEAEPLASCAAAEEAEKLTCVACKLAFPSDQG